MKTIVILFICSFFGIALFAQNPIIYKIYSSEGKEVTFDKMMRFLFEKEVVLVGEQHDNVISHWMEMLIAKELEKKRGSQLAIGSEMFETHQAGFLTQYLQTGNVKAFKDSAVLWPNFTTDYLPVLNFARTKGIDYFASNIPRKFASAVFKKGLSSLDSLSALEKGLICPLPFPFDSTLSQYAALVQMGKEMHGSGIQFAQAQAIKDATMAWNICSRLANHQQVLHFNGAYHSDFYQSIFWYIRHYRPETTIGTITTVSQTDCSKLEKEHKGKADFIVVILDSFPKTY